MATSSIMPFIFRWQLFKFQNYNRQDPLIIYKSTESLQDKNTILFSGVKSPSYLFWWPELCRNKPSSTEAPRPYGRNRRGGETSASHKAPAIWWHIRKEQKQFHLQLQVNHWGYLYTACLNFCVVQRSLPSMRKWTLMCLKSQGLMFKLLCSRS